ncbi:hypothetical protein ACSQ67_023123 [Phaseolus vulgaris]
MDASRIDIFEIYRRYSDIKSGHAYIAGEEGYRQDSDVQKAKFSRDALTQLSKLVESRVMTGVSVQGENGLYSANAIEFKVPQKASVHIASGVTASCDMMSLCGAVASCAMKLL